MRRRAMCLLGLTLAIGLLGVASAMAAAVSSPTGDSTEAPAVPLASCGSAVCVWEQANFSGGEGTVGCSAGSHSASGRSAINGYGPPRGCSVGAVKSPA